MTTKVKHMRDLHEGCLEARFRAHMAETWQLQPSPSGQPSASDRLRAVRARVLAKASSRLEQGDSDNALRLAGYCTDA